MADEIAFLEPWRPLHDGNEQDRIDRQLMSELVEGHLLWGKPFAVIGRNVASDDVIVSMGDSFAIVHLSFGPGSANFPSTRVYPTMSRLNDALWKAAVMQGFVDEFDHNDPRLWDESEGAAQRSSQN